MSSRRSLAGILIFVLIITSIVHGLWKEVLPPGIPEGFMWTGGICSWLAAILLVRDTPGILRIQVAVLLSVGTALILYTSSQGAQFSALNILTSNSVLLSMIAAVGFLRIVALPKPGTVNVLPTGRSAFVKTLIGVNVFSSFINISAPLLIADRIHQQSPIGRLTAQSIIRVFCSVSSWSPFFGAMAVVLTYAPGARLGWIALAGFPFTMLALGVVILGASLRYRKELDSFVGYPMQIRSLGVPALLVVCVVAGSMLLKSTPTLVVIVLSALLVTFGLLVIRGTFSDSCRSIQEFITGGLPRMVNELVLFLSAGVLAAGINGLVQNDLITNPFTVFDAATALKLLALMVVLSAIGIHPVIQITSFTPLILPLNPDPNLLAVTYLFAWHLGTCSSPLSGTNLVFQGRYDIPSWKMAVWNWPYALVMYLIAVAWLQFISAYFP